jgi:hypothetical protein
MHVLMSGVALVYEHGVCPLFARFSRMDVPVDQASSDESQLVGRLPWGRADDVIVEGRQAVVVRESRRGAAHCQGIGHRWGEIRGGYVAIPTSGQQASG